MMRKTLKFREKTKVVDAFQLKKDMVVSTKLGDFVAHPGDWVVTEPDGSQSVYTSRLFTERYSPYRGDQGQQRLTAAQRAFRNKYIWENQHKMTTVELARDPNVRTTQPRVSQIIAEMNAKLGVPEKQKSTLDSSL